MGIKHAAITNLCFSLRHSSTEVVPLYSSEKRRYIYLFSHIFQIDRKNPEYT